MRNTTAAVLALVLLGSLAACWSQDAAPAPGDALSVAAAQVTEKFIQAAQPRKGEVAELDTTVEPMLLYVTLGAKDGILEGQVLSIFAKGDPITVGGEIVGYKEKPVGTAEVTRVQGDKLCVAAKKIGLAGVEIVKGNLAYVKSVPGTLAMSGFLRSDKATCQMGQELADKLGTALQGSKRFSLVERERVEAMLRELKLGSMTW